MRGGAPRPPPLDPSLAASAQPLAGEVALCFAWHGAAPTVEVVNTGPLALLVPRLERLQVADLLDQHLPPDPPWEFRHGQVLRLRLAARLSGLTALVNIPDGAAQTGVDIRWDIPADKGNDDRLGRALEAFWAQR